MPLISTTDAGREIGGWSPQGVDLTPAPAEPAGVEATIRAAAARHGVNPDDAVTIARIESGLNPKARNPKSSAGGLFQFIDSTWNQYGGGDKLDAATSSDAGARYIRDTNKALAAALGREPALWETYLGHQQGATGAARILAAPDALAADTVGADAVKLNGGRDGMTNREFADLWRRKVDRATGQKPAFLTETLPAAFRNQNSAVSLAVAMNPGVFVVDPTFDPVAEAVKSEDLAPYVGAFSEVRNRDEFGLRAAQIRQQLADRDTLDAAGWHGIVASIGVGVLDPVNLVPVGGAAWRMSRAANIVLGAGRTALAGAAGAAASELLLHASQDTRTMDESLWSVGTATVLGGVLGGAVGAIGRRGLHDMAGRVDRELNAPPPKITPEVRAQVDDLVDTDFKSVGAAAMPQSAADELRLARGAEVPARVLANTPLLSSPDLVLATSPVRESREAMRALVRPALATEGDIAGIAPRENVEAAAAQWHGMFYGATQKVRAVYDDYRKAAAAEELKPLSRQEFSELAAKAGRRGDKAPDIRDSARSKALSQAAAIYRKEVFDPLRDEALKYGLLTQGQIDRARRFAESYIPRAWEIDKIKANRIRFRNEVVLPSVYRDWVAAKERLDTAAQITRHAEEQFRQVEAAGRELGGPEAAAFIEEGKARAPQQIIRDNIKALESAYADPSVTWHDGDDVRARTLIAKARTPEFARAGMEGIRKGGPALTDAEAQELQDITLRTLGMLPGEASDAGTRAARAVRAIEDRVAALKEAVKVAKAHEFPAVADDAARNAMEKQVADLTEQAARLEALAKDYAKATKKSLATRAKAMRQLDAEDHLGRLDDADLEGVADDIIDGLIGHTTNRIQYEGIAIRERGPMKSKTFNVRDTEVEDWIENDIEKLAQRYTATMASDIELKRLTGDVNGDAMRNKIVEGYRDASNRMPDGKAKLRLDKRLKADLEAFDGLVARQRGMYGLPSNAAEAWLLRSGRVLKAITFMSKMGWGPVSQISDVGRVIFHSGISRLMGDAIAPMVSNWRAVKLTKGELRLADIGNEVARSSMAMRGAEIFDDYGRTSAVERAAQAASQASSTLFGLNHWNAGLKYIAGSVAQAKLVRGVKALATGADMKPLLLADLNRIGIGKREAATLHRFIEEFGEDVRGVTIPNTPDWSGDGATDAVRLWRSAMSQIVDDQVINPGQDRPLWLSQPLGSVLGQLETFNLVSTQRTLLAGVQRRDAAVIQGSVAMIGLSMLSFWIKAQLAGWDMPEDADDWLVKGITGSGMLGAVASVERRVAAATSGAVGFDALTGSPAQSRYASAGPLSLFGPNASMGEIAWTSAQAMSRGDWNWRDTHRARTAIPLNNWVVIRKAFDNAEDRMNQAIGARPRPPRK